MNAIILLAFINELFNISCKIYKHLVKIEIVFRIYKIKQEMMKNYWRLLPICNIIGSISSFQSNDLCVNLSLFLVIIRVIYSFHKHFSVIYFIGKCFGYKLRQNCKINGAYNHGIHVIFFTDFAPIHTFFKFFFQY